MTIDRVNLRKLVEASRDISTVCLFCGSQGPTCKATCQADNVLALLDELEAVEMRVITPVCEVCFTGSWAPCEEGTPNAVNDPRGNGWMVCQMCASYDELLRLRETAISYENSKAQDNIDSAQKTDSA